MNHPVTSDKGDPKYKGLRGGRLPGGDTYGMGHAVTAMDCGACRGTEHSRVRGTKAPARNQQVVCNGLGRDQRILS